MLPALEKLGGPGGVGGRDTIWIDSLDEALTASVVLQKAGRRPDTLVSVLREFRSDWPAWVRFAATSRPDPDTKPSAIGWPTVGER